jgi:TRAP-type C4-dicarboxylate transport system permease small subunit
LKAVLKKIDHTLYRGEKLLAGVLFLLMALVMFASVLHRIYSREEGRLSAAALSILRSFGTDPDPATIHGPVSLALNLVLCFGLSYAALRTMRREPAWTRIQALGIAAGVTVTLAGFVKVILWAFPHGLIWGPVAALSCMLWVGFLGATVATYEKRHLALEMAEKIWPKKVLPIIRAIAMVITAGLCFFLLLTAVMSLQEHLAAWKINPLTANLLPTSIPKWAVLMIFPYAFGIMTLRFLATAAAGLAGEEVSAGELAGLDTGGGAEEGK